MPGSSAIGRGLQLEGHRHVQIDIACGDGVAVFVLPHLLKGNGRVQGVGNGTQCHHAIFARRLAIGRPSAAAGGAVAGTLVHIFPHRVGPGLAVGGVALQLTILVPGNGEGPGVIVRLSIPYGIVLSGGQGLGAAPNSCAAHRQVQGVFSL